MDPEDRQVLGGVVEVDPLQVVDDDVPAVGGEAVIVLIGHVEHELETLGVLALGDAADLGDGDASLDLCGEGDLRFFFRL